MSGGSVSRRFRRESSLRECLLISLGSNTEINRPFPSISITKSRDFWQMTALQKEISRVWTKKLARKSTIGTKNNKFLMMLKVSALNQPTPAQPRNDPTKSQDCRLLLSPIWTMITGEVRPEEMPHREELSLLMADQDRMLAALKHVSYALCFRQILEMI